MKINLADEIMSIFEYYGYTRNDIDWVGNSEFRVNVNWFLALAEDTDYDNGYGWENIPHDLTIFMKDGCWFSRREYDGSEWFVLNRVPEKPAIEKDFAYDRLVVPDAHMYDLDANWLRWFVA